MAYLYTTSAGVFVFDNSFKIKDKIVFNETSFLKIADSLEKGELIDAEKKLLAKHKDLIVLGEKEGVESTNEVSLLSRASQSLRAAGVFEVMRKNTILFTRKKVRESVRDDLFIVQTVNSLSELEHTINQFVRRVREWYSYYLPEFSDSIANNEKFIELIITKDKKTLLKEIKLSPEKSMGADIAKKDIEAILRFAKQIQDLYNFKKKQELYLEQLMNSQCPNITVLAGFSIGAKLIELAGSLKKLSLFPASTVQILGAEKALFRHLKTGARCPKYGILHEHKLVAHAAHKNKGKTARLLADKLSIAAKVDYFKGDFIGKKLKNEIDQKIAMMG